MQSKLTSVAVGVALVLGVVGLFVGDTTNPVVERTIERFGADAGPEKFETQVFNSGFSVGKTCVATGTTAAVGTLGNELQPDTSCVDVTPNGADLTLTLAASTTKWYPAKKGQVRTLYIRNATSTAGIDVIIAAGTGINLKRATSSGSQLSGDTDAENHARIDFKRQADGDLTALLEVFQD